MQPDESEQGNEYILKESGALRNGRRTGTFGGGKAALGVQLTKDS